MKKILVVDGKEIQEAVVAMVLRRQSTAGKFIGGAHLICDPDEPRPELRFRVNVILFDTEKAAREYSEMDFPPASDVGQANVLATTQPKPEGATEQ